ncbi:hypothetical protein C8Q80DRAFT_134499 [Daedaleopsis nitida]|nr:hypothetical protein C8Q80DRAFT_134499 [Daedaleopsis nitida]
MYRLVLVLSGKLGIDCSDRYRMVRNMSAWIARRRTCSQDLPLIRAQGVDMHASPPLSCSSWPVSISSDTMGSHRSSYHHHFTANTTMRNFDSLSKTGTKRSPRIHHYDVGTWGQHDAGQGWGSALQAHLLNAYLAYCSGRRQVLHGQTLYVHSQLNAASS